MFIINRSNTVTNCKKVWLLSMMVCLIIQAFPQEKKVISSSLDRPNLVVGIVVDQMRWDYLYRYYDRYGNGGFKRLINEGFSCENTFINYLPSVTAIGHTTIFTGAVPAISGIAGNDWIDQLTGKAMYCTGDSTVQSVGTTSKAGEMSPRNLLVSTVTDELRLATNMSARVIGVSLKDRASILPAGHIPTGSYWFDDVAGKFITSTYYMSQLPDWVNKFNDQNEPEKLTANGWSTLYPINTYKASSADDVAWEGKFKDEQTTAFPHKVQNIYKDQHSVIRNTPFGNTLTLDLAKAAIDAYKLGNGPSTDFLTINCASTDYVGHMFGVNAIEIEDVYLRLDKDLEAFFMLLDQKVGKKNYTVFLTADHGAAHSFSFLNQYNIPAQAWNGTQMVTSLNQLLKEKYDVPNIVVSGMDYKVNFNHALIEKMKLDYSAIKGMVVDYMKKQPGVMFVADLDKIGDASIPEPIKTKLINGYNTKRSGSVAIILEPGWFSGGKTGTSHGNWNPYDTHIPLLFMGKGIKHGSSNRTINMTDIAPTVSALLHIQMPSGCVGNVITEITSSN